MKILKSFVYLVACLLLQSCAQDVPQKTLLMLAEIEALKPVCLNGHYRNSFKGSMSTIFADCDAAIDLRQWQKEAQNILIARGWTPQPATEGAMYCLRGIKLIITEESTLRIGLILQYPNSRCKI